MSKMPERHILEQMYLEERLSLREVGERCGVSGSAVQGWLKKSGIPTRSKSQARLIALGKGKFEGMKLRKFDRGFFRKWSPEMAYLLGLVFADGHVNRWQLRFTFGEPSFGIIHNVKRVIGYDGPLTEIDNHGHPALGLFLGSTEMTNDLKELDVPWGNKSRTKTFPDVPEGLESHFVRGYFDGNGSVGKKLVRFSCGSREFVDGLQECIARCMVREFGVVPTGGNVTIGKPRMTKLPQGTSTMSKEFYTLIYASGQDRDNLYHWFYDDAPEFCYSERKRSAFSELVS